ncbi:MAG: hypothetical protein Q4Q03_00840, partial [Bowdeniella nasicola]|nr:hypothetical protein [Bowdeniella nasicola]
FLMLPSLIATPFVLRSMYLEQSTRADWDTGVKASEIDPEFGESGLPPIWQGGDINIVHIHLPRFDQYRERFADRKPRSHDHPGTPYPLSRTVTVTKRRVGDSQEETTTEVRVNSRSKTSAN